MKKSIQRGGKVMSILLLTALLMPVLAGSAKASDRDWDRHESRAHRWHAVHPVPVPGYVYAPPVVYYPPPPPSPGLNLIIPLHFN